MLERIVRTTVTKGAALDLSAVADPSDESNRKMADLLRAMGQAERAQMLRTLETLDADVIEQIKKLLYTFEDVKKLANRSIQKILGEIDSQTLAMALKGADEAIADKILANLSKRARATLVEEMEFLGHVKPAEQEAARSAICEVVGRLDESGDLEME
jgi:flagellar motor switch protein FliG